MNSKLCVLIVFAFAKAYTAQSQVFIDKVNAPKNPIGPYWGTPTAMDVKGPVYSVDFAEFPRDGKSVFTQSTISLEQAIKDKGSYLELKNGLIVTEKSKFQDDATTYAYDAQKRIIKKDNKFWLITYKYDSQSRVIEELSTSKEKYTTDKITYSYQPSGDALIVTVIYHYATGDVVIKEHYKNGLEFLSVGDVYTRRTTYEYDARGNWIKKKVQHSNQEYYELDRYIVYYDDLDTAIKSKQLLWERVPYTRGAKTGYPVIDFASRNLPAYALQIKKFLANKTIDLGALFYIPLGNRYYYGKDAFKDNENIGLKGKALEIAAGSEALVEVKHGRVKLFDAGRAKEKFKQHLYNNAFYLIDSLAQNHYVINDFNAASSKQFYTATKFPEGSMFYLHDVLFNEYRLFAMGEQLDDNKVGSWKFTRDGTIVAVYNGAPYMILSGSTTNKETGIYLAQPYKGEQLFDKNPNVSTSPVLQTAQKNAVTFNPKQPLQAKKTGNLNYDFYQNGALVQRPAYFVRVIGDQELLLGYGLEDFVILENSSVAIGETITLTKVARENEIIVMYLNGKASYFYNSGKVLQKNEYIITAVDQNRWLVYFPTFQKSAIVEINKPANIRFAASYTYSTNDWLYKTTGGAVNIYSQGRAIAASNFSLKSQGTDAFVYVHGKLSYYLAKFTTAPLNTMVPLQKYK